MKELKMEIRRMRYRNGGDDGVVFVEAVLAFPIFFLFVLGIIEFSRIAERKAALEVVAREALAIAQTVPNLDAEDDPATNEDEAALRQAAYQAIEDKLDSVRVPFRFGEFSAKTITVPGYPSPTNGETRFSSLEKNPISFEIESAYQTSFPLSLFKKTISIRANVSGFRELKAQPSTSQALDCNGNPVKAGGTPVETNCRCPQSSDPNAYWDPNQNRCVCTVANSSYSVGSGCQCNLGYEDKTPEDKELQCFCSGSSAPTCSASNQYFLSGGCSCGTCGSGYQANQYKTGCECIPTNRTNCLSRNTQFWTESNCACTSCSGGATRNSAGTGCDCTAAQISWAKENNRYLDPVTCADRGPCASGQVTASNALSCGCGGQPSGVTCRPGEVWMQSGGVCKCGCPNGGTYMVDGDKAGCADGICATVLCSWNAGLNRWVEDE